MLYEAAVKCIATSSCVVVVVVVAVGSLVGSLVGCLGSLTSTSESEASPWPVRAFLF
jgi:hypothetical protein